MRTAVWAVALFCATVSPAQTTAPVLTAISPTTVSAGGAAFTLTLSGSGFAANALVIWNGSFTLSTTFVSSSQLATTVPAHLIASPAFVVVQVQNPDGTRSAAFPLNITAPPVSILTETLPAAVVNSSYTATLIAGGGSPPFTWSLAPGSALPANLILNSSGIITGTPSTVGTFSFTVRVVDRLQAAAQKTLQLVVNPPPFSIASNSPLAPGTVGVAYSQQLLLSGGTPPYRWLISAAPPGLALDSATGVLRGTPTANGTFSFIVQVTENGGAIASKAFSVTINAPPLVISTDAVFAATVGLAYSQTFTAAGGIPPYRWSLISGSAGAGLSFDAGSATLSGTPQATGNYTFAIQVTDSVGVTTSKTYTLVVQVPQLNIITAPTLAAGVVGSGYSQRFTAVGGTPPYSWSIASGTVPGLSMDPSTGILGGIPSASGTFTFTVSVRDTAGITASRNFVLPVNPSALSITTARDLPAVILGATASLQMEASGGVPPYSWSANGLPDGLSVDSETGLVSGTPKEPGTFSFTVRVTDGARATAVDLFRIVINPPALPSVVLSGLPAVVEAATQPAIRLALSEPFPVELTGQLVITFVPDSGGGDNTIQFSTGGRSVSFTIPADSTSASFPVSELALQTGTVAGSVRVRIELRAAGVDITPNPAPTFTARVDRSAPVIRRVSFNRNSTGFAVQVIGFATPREVTEAVFRFAATGATLQTSEVRVPVESLFSPWFQDPTSSRFGSQFQFTQQFSVQGDSNVVTLESVTLTNRLGSTTARP